MSRRFRRAALAATIAAIVVSGLSACDPKTDATTPRGAGFQQTADGDLEIWFGEPCRDVVEVELSFVKDDADKDPVQYVLRAPGYVPSTALPRVVPDRGTGASSVTEMSLQKPVPGLDAAAALPTGLDWRDFQSVRLLVKTTAGQAATYLSTARLEKESADHGADEFYVQDQGWFNKDAFSAADGGDFKALCSSINPRSAPTPSPSG